MRPAVATFITRFPYFIDGEMHNFVNRHLWSGKPQKVAGRLRCLYGGCIFILLLKSFMIPLSVRFSSALSLTIFSVGEYFLTLLALVYFSFCDALRNGQSLGKCLFKISVVGFPYAPPCTVLQSALRKLPKALSSILDDVFVFFGLRRRLGDMLDRTVVINST